jgi:hypothetical protein
VFDLWRKINKIIYTLSSMPWFCAGIMYGAIRLWFTAGMIAGEDYVRSMTNENP